ncbi:hypothetical protein QO004_003298 [Rhizobium mesoamericanum]|uniref:hypothetical protein n=1 Tax=Rhizobium mesoamericanum TaxID=1079800 RepID=UPI002788DA74|nr:hypothetical protein [Rhizobium mesoamericanum]MDQ0561504.1 hypothetical protein [Rhizobium mesoamericanum]
MPTKARGRDHLKIIEHTVRYLFIDLDNVDAEWLGAECIYSYILRLARKDATDFSLFVDAADRIAELSDADERSRLMEALVMASMNKPGFGIRMLEWRMDEEIRRNLEEMIPLMGALRLTDEQRKAAERIAEVSDAPDAIFDKIRRAKPEEVGELYDLVYEAARTNNWGSLSYIR